MLRCLLQRWDFRGSLKFYQAEEDMGREVISVHSNHTTMIVVWLPCTGGIFTLCCLDPGSCWILKEISAPDFPIAFSIRKPF